VWLKIDPSDPEGGANESRTADRKTLARLDQRTMTSAQKRPSRVRHRHQDALPRRITRKVWPDGDEQIPERKEEKEARVADTTESFLSSREGKPARNQDSEGDVLAGALCKAEHHARTHRNDRQSSLSWQSSYGREKARNP